MKIYFCSASAASSADDFDPVTDCYAQQHKPQTQPRRSNPASSTSQWWEKVFGRFTVVFIENSQNTVLLVKVLLTNLICKMYLEGLFIMKLSHS